MTIEPAFCKQKEEKFKAGFTFNFSIKGREINSLSNLKTLDYEVKWHPSSYWFFAINALQHAEWDLNKIEKTFNGTFAGWKSMHQGLRIYFVWNSRLKAIEMVSQAA